jgi:hypothetical protein
VRTDFPFHYFFYNPKAREETEPIAEARASNLPSLAFVVNLDHE